jgi:hypothetical protein
MPRNSLKLAFKKMLEEKICTDVVLVLSSEENKEIEAHKCMLSHASTVL